jgi:CheY-like chemotaxis protein
MAQDARTATHILIIDTHQEDAALIKESIEATSLRCDIAVALSGSEALENLRRHEPALIFLDAAMNNDEKIPLLQIIKSDPALRVTPIILLGREVETHNIALQYEMGANCYIPKPENFMKFKKVIGVLIEFWLNIAKLPAQNP